MWARAAAAILCIGAGAGLANVDVRYGEQGLSVRTGWLTPVASRPSTSLGVTASLPSGQEAAALWRDDLAALERQLRTEFRPTGNASSQPVTIAQAAGPSMPDAELLRRMRGLVEESERRQARELALRVGQVLKDVSAQRQSDLRKIDSNLGVIQSNTGAEILRQRQMQMNMMNYIVKVSEKK